MTPSQRTPLGTVVIVTYNCAGYIRGCLQSLRPEVENWEVIVVDNGSRDDTTQVVSREFPWAKLIATGANRGFSAANNTGAAAATAPWLFFLNPDTIVIPGALETLLAAANARRATVIAPRMNEPDGRYQPGSSDDRMPTFISLLVEALLPKPVRPELIRRGTGPGGFDPARAQMVERPMAAAVMIRRDVYEAVGGFDERFHPIWFEDVDLSKRLRDRGHEIWYEPAAVITHVGNHSRTLYNLVAVQAMWNANMVRYARKNFPGWQAATLRASAAAGIVIRGFARIFDPRFVRAVPGHLRLGWRMARYADESRWYDVKR